MNISKKWLQEYVQLGECSVEMLCEKLTDAGIEVEAVEEVNKIADGVVVAKILSREKHPDADRLSICKVFDGTNEVQIVCGAPNCDAGNVVPMATVGTVLKSDEGEFKIKKSKIRGVESCGMLCAADELGLAGGHEGLMILDENTPLGKQLSAVFDSDCKIEVEVTPNRPDWLSHWGIARDVACLLDAKTTMPNIVLPKVENAIDTSNLVTVEASDLCPLYTARVIKGIKVGESPQWLKERLLSVGLRPINNVVDITNFVMFELGIPLHAFDLNKLVGNRVIVRRAKDGEKIVTLDGKLHNLKSEYLVIADEEKPVALAGIMGGEYSGVDENTTDLLIEGAIFSPVNIRLSRKVLGIFSDAAYRYERGTDYDMASIANDRTAQLILEIAGGSLATERVEVTEARPEEKEIKCRFNSIRSLIGYDISNEKMVDIFTKLSLKVSSITEDSCIVTAPLFRLDLEREADLAEEIARINGLAQVPEIAVNGKVCASISEDAYAPFEKLRNSIISLGFYECMHYSMVNEVSALSDSRFEKSDLIELANPLSLELAYMRPSLLGEMLGTLERNISRRNLSLCLFEMGKSFCKNIDKYPEERNEICFALSGVKYPEQYGETSKEVYDFYDLKGAIEGLFEMNKISNYRFKLPKENNSNYESKVCAEIEVNGKIVGFIGELNRKVTKSWRTQYSVFIAQLDADKIIASSKNSVKYKPIAQFPATSRDVAFVVDKKLSHAEIMEFIKKSKPQNLESIKLFDIFVDDELEKSNKKSMAYGLTFRNSERTLTDAEVNKSFEALREKLVKDLKVELR